MLNTAAADKGNCLEAALESAHKLVRRLAEKRFSLVLAESCTAGLASALLACVPGASRVLWGSFACYTAQAKAAMLGLDPQQLELQGLVSEETACGMASGAREKSGADLAAAVTGLAGPDGDGSAVPVGTVWIATACGFKTDGAKPNAKMYSFSGTRDKVRLQAVRAMFLDLLDALTAK
jgi:PncC family amidohydrolase